MALNGSKKNNSLKKHASHLGDGALNRRERLMGWNEHRSGGAHFRATVSWSDQFSTDDADPRFTIPNLADVLEAILIGSVKSELDLPLNEEFDLYRGVVRELYKRVNESQSSYE